MVHLRTEEFHCSDVAGDAGEVEGRGTKVIRLLRIEPGVYQHLHQSGKAFIGGPVQGGVSVDVGEVGRGLFAQQEGGHHGAAEHAGHHQRGQTLVVSRVHGDPGSEENVNNSDVAVTTGPVYWPGTLAVVGVLVNVASVLDEEPAEDNDNCHAETGGGGGGGSPLT